MYIYKRALWANIKSDKLTDPPENDSLLGEICVLANLWLDIVEFICGAYFSHLSNGIITRGYLWHALILRVLQFHTQLRALLDGFC